MTTESISMGEDSTLVILPDGQEIETYEDERAIPIGEVRRAYDNMLYASPERVMFAFRFLTGCRGNELDMMRKEWFVGGILRWPCSKKQRSWRKAKIPLPIIKEWLAMQVITPSSHGKLFPITNSSFRKYFNRDIRPVLSGAWTRKVLRMRNSKLKPEFMFSLGGLRKTRNSIYFFEHYKKHGDAFLASVFMQQEMAHKFKETTATNYLRSLEAIGLEKNHILKEKDLLKVTNQKRLIEYQ